MTLKLSQVKAGYGSVKIIKEVSFELNKGENLCILGPNGCGKTTVLKSIAGILSYEGSITIDGKEVRTMKRKEAARKVALLSQFSTIAFDYTVYETVMMGRYTHIKQGLWSVTTAEDREKVMECLTLTNLLELKDHPVNQLSGGQKQRVFLAKVLAQDPDILLLDEPNNHLDIKHQLELIGYLKDWGKNQDKTIIGVFHDIRLALSLSDQVLFMKAGQVIKQGPFLETASRKLLKDIFDVDLVKHFQEQSEIWEKLGEGASQIEK